MFYFIFPYRRIREETRTVIRGVRLNRRFDLQMAHRRMNWRLGSYKIIDLILLHFKRCSCFTINIYEGTFINVELSTAEQGGCQLLTSILFLLCGTQSCINLGGQSDKAVTLNFVFLVNVVHHLILHYPSYNFATSKIHTFLSPFQMPTHKPHGILYGNKNKVNLFLCSINMTQVMIWLPFPT